MISNIYSDLSRHEIRTYYSGNKGKYLENQVIISMCLAKHNLGKCLDTVLDLDKPFIKNLFIYLHVHTLLKGTRENFLYVPEKGMRESIYKGI